MKFDSATVQSRIDSPLGPIILAATPRGIAGLWFVERQRHAPDTTLWPHAPDHPLLRQAQRQLAEYFAGTRSRFDLALDLQCGTAFQRAVWDGMLAIPHGGTTSYGDLSRRIGSPSAVRAVGAAVGRNPVSIMVPCHRVLGSGGTLTGYAGGLDRKTALLQLEGALI